MNDIDEILEIIEELDGKLDTDAILDLYCKKHKMVSRPEYRSVIQTTIKKNMPLIQRTIKKNSVSGDNILTVGECRYFKTIRDTMQTLFKKSVPMMKCYFPVMDDCMVWFPQPKNDNWENTFTPDGKFWYEKPKTAKANYVSDGKMRYIFIHEKDGYRFTGKFKPIEMLPDKTRVYEFVDDKLIYEK